MRRATKIWLLIAASLILLGCIIFGGAMTMLKWDFSKLQTAQYETNEYTIHEAYQSICITGDTADIIFVPSEDAKHTVICYEQKNAKHAVSVKDGTLTIELADTRKWFEHLGITFIAPRITVCIPQGEYGALIIKSSTGDIEIPEAFHFEHMDISENTGNITIRASASDAMKIKTSTGDICVENASAGSLDLSVSTGAIQVANVSCNGDVSIHVSTGKTTLTGMACKNLTSDGNTGDISLNNVIAAEKLTLHRSTGDIKFEGSDAAEIYIETSTGHVAGTLLSEKIFIVRTDTGKVDVPRTVTGGRCEISTDTGNIKVSIR